MTISYEVAARGQQKYLNGLAPPEITAYIEYENVCAIVAVAEEEGSRSARTPVGIIIFEEDSDGTRRIIRLYVSEAARGKGIARRLLKYYSEDGERPALWLIFGKALFGHGFYERAERDREKTGDIRPFSDFTRRTLSLSVAALSQGRADVLASADEDASLLLMRDDSPEGVLAIAREQGVYRILLLEAVNRRTQMRLLEAECLLLKEKMNEKDIMAVDSAVPKAADWMEKLFGKSTGEKLLRVECNPYYIRRSFG